MTAGVQVMVIPRGSEVAKRVVSPDLNERDHAPPVHGAQHDRATCHRRRASFLDQRFVRRDPGVNAVGRHVRDIDRTPGARRKCNRYATGTMVGERVALEVFVRTRHPKVS